MGLFALATEVPGAGAPGRGIVVIAGAAHANCSSRSVQVKLAPLVGEPKGEHRPQDEDGAQQVHSLVITWSQPRRVEARIGADRRRRPHPSTIRRYSDASER